MRMTEPVLVTGAGGFIGRHLVRALAQRGQPVLAMGRRIEGTAPAGVETVDAGATDPAVFAPLLARSSAVVHLASVSTPGSSAGRPLAELDNLRLCLALLEALQAHPHVPLLYVSSGGTLYGDSAHGQAQEARPLHPKSYYGAGKASAEHFIDAWCSQYGGSATVLRPSNVYGPGQSERPGFGIVPGAMGKLLRGEPLTVWGDGSAQRDYLYIDDFVALCLAALDAPMPRGMRVFNAASGIGTSLGALLETIETVAGRALARVNAPQRSVDVSHIALDTSRAREAYGWAAATPLAEGIRRTWAWFASSPR